MKRLLRRSTKILLYGFMALFLAGFGYVWTSETDKQIVGWIEHVTLLPANLKLKAKLDTGARHSSLHAVNIIEFKRHGETFVRFDLTNWKGQTETIEAKVSRMAKIKQHNTDPDLRLVIRIEICLANITKEVDVNLVNRSNFNYQLLVGRSFLKGDFVIDPAGTFTVKANCQKVLHDE